MDVFSFIYKPLQSLYIERYLNIIVIIIIVIIMFVDRAGELAFLNKEYERDTYSFIVLYGRRRVGKTELIKMFIKDKPHVYFLASEEPTNIQLQRLIARVAEHFNERVPKIGDWLEGITYIGEKMQENRLVVVIDEFPYLVKSNTSIPSFFQPLTDGYLKDSRSMLILCGSSIGIMESEVLGSKSPLYGRRTGQIDLEPFDFQQMKLIIKRPIKACIEVRAIFGGVPMYLGFFNNDDSLENNILNSIINKNAYLYKEPELILKQEFRAPAIYMSILGSVAQGHTQMTAISQSSGIACGTLSKYIKNLMEVRLIEREVCVTERNKRSKKSLYTLKDGLFNFWFRFIEPHLSDVETHPKTYLKDSVLPELPHFVSKTYEDVCREFVRKKLAYGTVGRWWYKDNEIDIVGLNRNENNILFGECKWKDNVDPTRVLRRLKQKAQKVRWSNETRNQEFAIFARSFSKTIPQGYDLKDLGRFFHMST